METSILGEFFFVGALVNSLNPRLMWMIAAVFSALSVGSVARLIALRGAAREVVHSRIGSLKTWWTLAALLTAAVLFAPLGVIVLVMVASWLGFEEYSRFVATERKDRGTLLIAFACIPLNYALILSGQVSAFVAFIPVASLLMLAAWKAASGHTTDYIRSTAGVHFGLMVTVYSLSHAALLFTLPESQTTAFGNVGWFLFLVILTEANDIAQALVGRRIGRNKVTPVVSPNKSWEGLLGGTVVTTVLAVVLAPHLAPFTGSVNDSRVWAVASGLMISLVGFLGDINMSAIKRDVGVKDGSTLLPGQGGAIDRIDSLTFTAPAFYYLLLWLL